MSKCWNVLLVGALAGCATDPDQAPLDPDLAGEAHRLGRIRVIALAQSAGPDTASIKVPGALILVRRSDSIPDTLAAVALAVADRSPPRSDSAPPPPPPDSTSPPPPTCNVGPVVARGRTNQAGFDQFRLPAGRYDVVVVPPPGIPNLVGVRCGLAVIAGRLTVAPVTLPAVDSLAAKP